MLRPFLQQLGRLESLRHIAATAPASTLGSWRAFSSADDASTPSEKAEAPDATPEPSTSGAKPSRLQTKEWRSWIDTKLDSKLQAVQEDSISEPAGSALASAAPAAPAADAERHATIAQALAAAPAEPPQQEQEQEQQAAQPPKPQPTQPAAPRLKGFELEQQIFSIVAPPARPAEESPLPEGVTSYGQLAMAADAPRFERGAYNIGELSPHRIHPSRLFYPSQSYAPGELDPYRGSQPAHDFNQPPRPPATPDDVTRLADYKNAPFLAQFLSETGKLPLRRKTQLRAKLHRHLARQVKTARQLAILSPMQRWQPPAAPQVTQQRRRA